MAVQIIGSSGAVADIEPTARAMRVAPYPPDAPGAFRLAAVSGLTTGIAAGAALFLFRNPDPAKLVTLQMLKIRGVVVTGFTAAQEIGFDVINYNNWLVDAGGALISAANHNMKKRSTLLPSAVNVRIPTTTALRAPAAPAAVYGNPFMAGMAKTLAAAATVQDAVVEEAMDCNLPDFPMTYGQNEGFAVRNSIAMGAAGTIRWTMTCAWTEGPVA
jgi:hypothetical protein